MIRLIIFAIAGPLFIISIAVNIIIWVKMRKNLTDLEDYYWEFEDQHPTYQRYQKLRNISFIISATSVLAIFAAAMI